MTLTTENKTISEHMFRHGGRRFLLTLGAGLVDTMLLVGGYIGEGSYVQLTVATVAVYIAANTHQKVKGS